MNRAELVKSAIKKAYEEKENNTIITEYNGVQTVTTFYKKNKAIWCKMVTGCITTDNRVYKVNTEEPYIRGMGGYWRLTGNELAIVKRMANA